MAGLAIPLFRARAATNLMASFDGDNIYPVAPSLHFLTGKLLNRLVQSADTQRFVSQVTLFADDRGTLIRQPAHSVFIVSYSIWEEKFKVAIPGPAQLSKEGLSLEQAEQWALENVAISASGVAPDRPFKMRFELRTQSAHDLSKVLGNNGISLSDSLIEIFSRKLGAADSHWSLDTGWLRLLDLPRLTGRPRIG